MGPIDAIFSGFEKSFTWEGRASRSEYWYFYLCVMVPIIIMLTVETLGVALLGVGCAFLVALPSLSLTVRRLHDTNRSGWWYWIIMVPLIGPLISLVFMCLPSDPDTNDYGYSPLSSW